MGNVIAFNPCGVCEKKMCLMCELNFRRKAAIKNTFIYRPHRSTLDEAMAEAQVMAVLCEFHWSGKKYADRAVFLTDNLTENTIKKLKRLYSGTYAEFKNGVSLYGRQEQSDV
jgi:hypothetical protein